MKSELFLIGTIWDSVTYDYHQVPLFEQKY